MPVGVEHWVVEFDNVVRHVWGNEKLPCIEVMRTGHAEDYLTWTRRQDTNERPHNLKGTSVLMPTSFNWLKAKVDAHHESLKSAEDAQEAQMQIMDAAAAAGNDDIDGVLDIGVVQTSSRLAAAAAASSSNNGHAARKKAAAAKAKAAAKAQAAQAQGPKRERARTPDAVPLEDALDDMAIGPDDVDGRDDYDFPGIIAGFQNGKKERWDYALVVLAVR